MAVKFLSKETAKILSNKTARKILENLDKKKSTSQIAKELNLPLTTVDYNISQLQKAGLIKSGYYKWSKRGNKMNLYEQAGEILVFAPEEKQKDILDALNKFTVPVVLGISAISGFVFQKLLYGLPAARTFAAERATASMEDSALQAISQNAWTTASAEPQLWLWFMIASGIVLLVLYLLKLRKTS